MTLQNKTKKSKQKTKSNNLPPPHPLKSWHNLSNFEKEGPE